MDNNISSIRSLLSQISVIKKKYSEIAEITGDNFNIFQILNIQTDEVGTHSAFLCELLNAKGSHGMKKTFIDLFINQQREKNKKYSSFIEKLELETEDSHAASEYIIGPISKDKRKGGRIDILIKDNKKKEIIIENKIYAHDQDFQLLRYHNYNKNAPIFYLTLNDNQIPSDRSICELTEGVNYICISYETDIVDWLKICLEKATDKPILRESIKQYINLIKYLTSQTMNEEMKKEIIELITKEEEYFYAAEEIFMEFDEIRKNFYLLQWKKIINELKEKHSLEEMPENTKEYDFDLGLTIKINDEEHFIVIGFDDDNRSKTYISFRKSKKERQDKEILKKIQEAFENGKFEKEKVDIYLDDNIDYCALYPDIKKSSDIYSKFVSVLVEHLKKID